MDDEMPPSGQPLVTIAMPVHNAAVTIDATVRSVLAQTYKNWRLMIVDDGSDDLTARVVENHTDDRIYYVADGRRLGLSARLNQIIDGVQNGYLARLDADDIAYPERLDKQVAFLEQHVDVDLVGSAALLFRDDGSVEGVLDVEPMHEDLSMRRWHGFRIPHPSWLGRVHWFKSHRYNPKMARAQDQELLLRAVEVSRYACLPEILIGYRKTGDFLSKRISGRTYHARALIDHAMTMHEYGRMPRIIAEQIVKMSFDIILRLPILGGIFTHPAGRPATSGELARWNMLVRDVRLLGKAL